VAWPLNLNEAHALLQIVSMLMLFLSCQWRPEVEAFILDQSAVRTCFSDMGCWTGSETLRLGGTRVTRPQTLPYCPCWCALLRRLQSLTQFFMCFLTSTQRTAAITPRSSPYRSGLCEFPLALTTHFVTTMMYCSRLW
jgi:hypothetical protein